MVCILFYVFMVLNYLSAVKMLLKYENGISVGILTRDLLKLLYKHTHTHTLFDLI